MCVAEAHVARRAADGTAPSKASSRRVLPRIRRFDIVVGIGSSNGTCSAASSCGCGSREPGPFGDRLGIRQAFEELARHWVDHDGVGVDHGVCLDFQFGELLQVLWHPARSHPVGRRVVGPVAVEGHGRPASARAAATTNAASARRFVMVTPLCRLVEARSVFIDHLPSRRRIKGRMRTHGTRVPSAAIRQEEGAEAGGAASSACASATRRRARHVASAGCRPRRPRWSAPRSVAEASTQDARGVSSRHRQPGFRAPRHHYRMCPPPRRLRRHGPRAAPPAGIAAHRILPLRTRQEGHAPRDGTEGPRWSCG